jgi:hypothetical protein
MRTFLSTLLLASALAPGAFAQEPQAPAPATPQPATSDSGQYISFAGGSVGGAEYDYGNIGVGAEIKLESGFGFAGAWGADAGDWRFEFALSYRSQAVESINDVDADFFDANDVSVLSLDMNAYYDLPTGSDAFFKPYVGGGLGVGAMSLDDGIMDDSGGAITLQAIGGAAFVVSDNSSLFLEGRYQWASVGLDTNGDDEDAEEYLSFGGFGVYAGVRFGI